MSERWIFVGNGPSAGQGGLGHLIDEFDVVVRFNQFHTEPPYDEHVGSKTTIWVTCGEFSNRAKGPKRRSPELYDELWFFHMVGRPRNLKCWQKLVASCVRNGAPLPGIIPTPIANALGRQMPLKERVKNRVCAMPSTGLIAIDWFIRSRDLDKVWVHGFDNFRWSDPENPDEAPEHHYFWKHRPGLKPHGWHTPYAEAALMDRWLKEGRVEWLRRPA